MSCRCCCLLGLLFTAELVLAGTPDSTASPVATVLARLDRNTDGRLDREEYLEFRRPWFARADADGNAALSRAEFEASLAGAVRASAATRFATFDADRDGTLSVAEIERMLQPDPPAAATLDTDGNGSVSAVEYVTFQSRRFPAHDTNADGGLSLPEFKASLEERPARLAGEYFPVFDRNRDKRLSAREFVNYHAFVFRKFLDPDRDDAVALQALVTRLQEVQ